ncbi:MAG: hypothetical protein IH598_01695 [Bacteroidales bacterium]|nr:hypothetical protein [Bacteroidales bacterium]
MNIQILAKPRLFFILLVFLFFGAMNLRGQQAHPILSYFTAVRVNNTVQINWAISGGNTCNGILIQRSTDGIFFEVIGEIGGVCGSPDVDVPYVFTDENPESNQTNYYRLELGSQGFTNPVTIEYFPLNVDGFSLILDKNAGIAYIHFANPEQNLATYRIYSIDGRFLRAGETNDSVIIFDFSVLPVQLFVANITISTSAFSVKISKF